MCDDVIVTRGLALKREVQNALLLCERGHAMFVLNRNL